MTWTNGSMLAFDTETTGVERDAYILSAALVHINRTGSPEVTSVVTSDVDYLNHGVPIPTASSAIHGLTEGLLAEHGHDPATTLEEICLVLAANLQDGIPLVGMNIEFDLTRLDRNCRRYGVTPLSDRCEIAPVLDALVLDKGVDRYRKGKRRLVELAALYRVPWDEQQAHSADADALAAARVVWRIGRMYPAVGRLSLPELHALQTIWKRQQDVNMAAYRKREGQPFDGLDGAWPVRLPDPELEESLF